jgi:hypothetical protein
MISDVSERNATLYECEEKICKDVSVGNASALFVFERNATGNVSA